jgi:thiol-disulfide isomerase/thioredoxin
MKSIELLLAVASVSLLTAQAQAVDGPVAVASGVVTPGTGKPAGRAARSSARAEIAGTWRAAVRLPGGEAPFALEIRGADADPVAVAHSAGEVVPFSRLELSGAQVVLAFADPGRVIRARLAADGQRMEGTLHDERAGNALPFAATRGAAPRFAPPAAGVALPTAAALAAVPSVSGTWTLKFVDDEAIFDATGELRDQGHGVITGTFLTPAGDYRQLEGTYDQGLLRLSAIDGARALLVHARARKDGTLDGDLWVDDGYHALWTAERRIATTPGATTPGAATPGAGDPFARVRVTHPGRKLRVTMPDLAGRPVSLEDPRFRGKVVVVDIFGTWCSTCADQAPLLVEWHRRYRAQGLEIVGLAFELSGEHEHDRRAVRRFQKRFGIEFPLLLSDAADVSEIDDALPDLSGIEEYPTTILIGRDGTVRYIHSGFAGTGGSHGAQRPALERRIEQLLDEPASRLPRQGARPTDS